MQLSSSSILGGRDSYFIVLFFFSSLKDVIPHVVFKKETSEDIIIHIGIKFIDSRKNQSRSLNYNNILWHYKYCHHSMRFRSDYIFLIKNLQMIFKFYSIKQTIFTQQYTCFSSLAWISSSSPFLSVSCCNICCCCWRVCCRTAFCSLVSWRLWLFIFSSFCKQYT